MEKKRYLEEEAYRLSRDYINIFFSRFRYKLFSLKNVKNTKWWSSFGKAVYSFSREKEWNSYKYVAFTFKNNEKPFPFVLVNRKNWEAYKDDLISRTKGDASMALSLLTTYNEIREWSIKNKFDKISVRDFFSEPKNLLFLKRRKFSPYFLSISRTFNSIFNSMEEEERAEIINKEELLVKRALIINNEKISKKLKEVLGDEYIGFR